MKTFFSASASTIGGAALILVLTIFLGDKAPWFVEKLHAKIISDYSISVNVDSISIPQSEFDKASSDKFVVDKNEKFLLKKPNDPSWNISSVNPGRILDGLSLLFVPYFGYSATAFSKLVPIDSLTADDIVTTTISSTQDYLIQFSDKSKISGFELAFNPCTDTEFVKTSLIAGASMMNNIDPQEVERIVKGESQEAREAFSLISQTMEKRLDQIIKDRWPKPQRVVDNVTVTTFSKRLLTRNTISQWTYKSGTPTLMTNFNFLILINPELMNASIQHIEISKKNDVILIDASVTLENISVNNIPVTKVELARTILIIDRSERINVVTLTYLTGPGSTRARLKELESILLSLRVVK